MNSVGNREPSGDQFGLTLTLRYSFGKDYLTNSTTPQQK